MIVRKNVWMKGVLVLLYAPAGVVVGNTAPASAAAAA